MTNISRDNFAAINIYTHLQPGLRLFTLRRAISSSILLCMVASKYSRGKKQRAIVLSYLLLGIYSSQDQASWVSFSRVFSTEAVMGTPTFFLNDVFIGGDASSNWGEKQWNGMIDKILT